MLEQQKPKKPVTKQGDNSIAGVKPRADGRFYSLDGTKSMSAKEFKEDTVKMQLAAKEAKLKQAVNDIVLGKAFDNGMICASEQAAIVDREIYDEFIKLIKAHRVYFVNAEEKAKLEKLLFGVEAYSQDVETAKLNSVIVGKYAEDIAKMAGFEVPKGTVILAAECKEVGVNEPLTREKLSPVLAILKSTSTEDGIEKSRQMVEFNGLGHSAAVHTQNADVAEEFGKVVRACRIVWNSPSTFRTLPQ